jgi:hypothetical protein
MLNVENTGSNRDDNDENDDTRALVLVVPTSRLEIIRETCVIIDFGIFDASIVVRWLAEVLAIAL